MPDLLVKLYALPPLEAELEAMRTLDITLRRPLAPERHRVVEWTQEHWNPHWASEITVAFAHHPIHAFIAVRKQALLGFACYDCTMLGFFGPTGVLPEHRRQGLGRALLIAALHALREKGYAYGIIGGAGPVDFYKKHVGATVIDGSAPGIYRGMLR